MIETGNYHDSTGVAKENLGAGTKVPIESKFRYCGVSALKQEKMGLRSCECEKIYT